MKRKKVYHVFGVLVLCVSLLGLMNADVRVEAYVQPEMWWYDIGTGSVCWRADLAYGRFCVDFDGDHNTFAFTNRGAWDPEWGDWVALGVCARFNSTWRYGWAFKIGELRVDGPTAHINETYVPDPTEWFYFWVPKTTPPTDWVVCLQKSDGVNPIEVRDTFWYSVDGGWTWNEFTPPSSLNVTIKAHCHTEGLDVNVSIIMDGSPTGYTTPHTFTGLTAIHTFSVPSIDPHGCQFTCWSICETSTSITVTASGTYTAYYNTDAYDVAVKNVTASKTVVGQNYTMSINVTVENQGNSKETFGVVAPYFDGVAIPTSLQWETFWSMGDINRDGYIDLTDYDIIYENWAWYGPPGENPADINSDGSVDIGDAVIWVLNQGLDIWTYYELPVPPKGTQRGVRLHPCTQTTLTFTWNTTGVVKGNYTISAYAAPVDGETDLADNNFTDGWVFVTIQGDVDGDRDVDIYDVVKITGIYGSKRGDPQFNPNSDLDDDGEIKIYDVVRCTSHYGQKEP